MTSLLALIACVLAAGCESNNPTPASGTGSGSGSTPGSAGLRSASAPGAGSASATGAGSASATGGGSAAASGSGSAAGPDAKAPTTPAGAQAQGPFAVLFDNKRTWTYDIVNGEAGKPTGKQVTLSVTAVDRQGAYALIDVAAKGDGQFAGLTLLVGANGVREVLTVGSDPRDEKLFRNAYDNKYLPRVYLPATLKPQHVKGDLERFGEDNRTYKVTGAVTKRNPHTWRMTWKGSYTVAEGEAVGANTKTKYAAVVDFDPDVGFTLICPADDKTTCLRLHT
jgi:hypothetical protein